MGKFAEQLKFQLGPIKMFPRKIYNCLLIAFLFPRPPLEPCSPRLVNDSRATADPRESYEEQSYIPCFLTENFRQ